MSNYVIIGASSGIGQQLASQLIEAGQQVYATYFRNELTSLAVFFFFPEFFFNHSF